MQKIEEKQDDSEKHKKSLKEKIKLFFKKNVKEREFFQNKFVRWFLFLGIFLNLINWVALLIFIKPVDLPVILHYNVYFGVDMTGNWKRVFLLPLIGLAIFIINFFLAVYFFREKERIASHMLLMAAFMAQLSLLIAAMSVIIINY